MAKNKHRVHDTRMNFREICQLLGINARQRIGLMRYYKAKQKEVDKQTNPKKGTSKKLC